MESFIFSLNIVLPIFLLVMFGYYLKKINFVNEPFLKIANQLAYKIFIPLIVFRVIYNTNLNDILDFKFIGVAALVYLIYVAVLIFIVPRFVKNGPILGSLMQGMTRSNFALFGTVLALNIYGEVGVTAVLLAFIVPLFNVVAVILLSTWGDNGKVGPMSLLMGVVKNPIIIAMFVGFVLNMTENAIQMRIPNSLMKPVYDLATMGTPLALLSLGARFQFSGLKRQLNYIIVGTIGKLIVMPVAVLSVIVMMGYRDAHLVAILAMAATPTAVSSYVMAEQMKCDGELAGNLVVVTSLLSSVTLFIFLFFLRNQGFI